MIKTIQKLTGIMLFAGVIGLLMAASSGQTAAQDDDLSWSDPVNLSKSGTASELVVAKGPGGQFHAFWQDPFVGFVYTSGNGQAWAPPIPVPLPATEPFFTTPRSDDFEGIYTPSLAIDSNGILHGFWVDADQILWYSQAPIGGVPSQLSWTRPVVLAEAAVAVETAVDANGFVHVSYIRPDETELFPPGIYHRRSGDGGASWSEGNLLYTSNYLRSLLPENAHMKLLAANENELYLVWDDPLVESVFLVWSQDGGETWTDPMVVDQREPDDDPLAAGPAQIDIDVMGSNIHMTWRAGIAAERCGQFHQWSRNGGETWQPEPEVAIEETGACPTDGHVFIGQDGLIFLLTTIRELKYLQAWDDFGWSEAEVQNDLSAFTNPQTYRPVSLGCLEPMLQSDNRLTVFGCSENDNPDMWVMERPLGDVTSWAARFQPTPVWDQPIEVSNKSEPFASIELLYAGDERLHAFWAQSSEEDVSAPDNGVPQAIYYSRLDDDLWSPPRPILQSPVGKADQPAAAADAQGNLFLVWSGGVSGQIYFSRAVAERAISVTEWAAPQALPSIRPVGSWPDILADSQNNLIHVVYSIPLNEDRGIYLTQSSDEGDSWISPIQVFDGEEAGWEMVGQPRLTMTSSGHLHLLWAEMSQPGGLGPLSLVYARSVDQGQTWSDPNVVSDDPVVWSQIVGQGERTLHLAWLSVSDNRVDLLHQYSRDNGLTWETPVSVFDPNTQTGPTTMISAVDTVFLFQLSRRLTDDEQLLQQWRWDGERWRLEEDLELGSVLNANTVSAVAAPDGNLSVLYGYLALDQENSQLLSSLRHTNRTWDVPLTAPTPLPTLTPTPVPLATATSTPGPSPTPTIPLADTAGQDNGSFAGGNPVVVSIIPAALLVMVVFVFGMRAVRSR